MTVHLAERRIMLRRHRILWPAVACAFLLLTSGCSSDDPIEPEEPEAVLPGTPELLLQLFITAHEELDIDIYGKLLHEGFKFFLQRDDIENLGLPFDHLNRDDDIACMTHIFSGAPYLRPDGEVEAGISQITFSRLEQRSTWAPSDHPDFPDAQRAGFEVDMAFHRPGDTTILINGLAEFYVTSRDSLYLGENVQFWQIRGIVDQTNSGGKATENVSWGSTKALYK